MNNCFIDGYYIPNKLEDIKALELLEKISLGDRVAFETFAKHNIRLVIDIVNKKFYSDQYDRNDLIAIGNVGLTKAIKTFDLNKKIKFATYADKCIINEILMFIRKERKNIKAESLDIPYNKDDSKSIIYDRIEAEINLEEGYMEKERLNFLSQLVDNLPERDKEIIKMYFGFYNDVLYKQRDIAEKLNLTQSSISKKIPMIIKKLSKQLEYYYGKDLALNQDHMCMTLKK